MRSYLFVPGDSERKLAKAADTGADALILDLEDSVAWSRKAVARTMTAAHLAAAPRTGSHPALIVRVNALSTGMTDEDLSAVVAARPDAILLPKSGGGADVQQLAVRLSVEEATAGLEDGAIGIIALVTETAGGVLNAGSYGGKTKRLRALTWGAEDLATDLGALANRDEAGRFTDVFRLARAMTLIGAATAGVEAIDTVFTDFSDARGLERECQAALRDGFGGKMAIHPAQVETINRVFTPSEATLERARRIVALFQKAGPEAGVLTLDGAMIDRPHLRQAERLLARSERMAGDRA